MLDTDVDPLLDVSVADNLVDDHPDGVRGDVVDDARRLRAVSRMMISGQDEWNAPMHAPLLSSISLDVNDVSDVVILKVGGELDLTVF